jgi:dTDP-4-dehydrorhamnose 3,5-epimerase
MVAVNRPYRQGAQRGRVARRRPAMPCFQQYNVFSRLDLMSAASDPVPFLPLIIIPKRHADSRGWLGETFHDKRLRDLGIACAFVQDNQTRSTRRGTLRGFHFQKPPAAQAKLISVLHGRILDVAVDIRRNSPTYGKYVSAELSSDDGKQLFVPTGFAHGFLTLADGVSVLYKASDYYAPSDEGGIRWDDPNIAFPWPLQRADIVLSERDERLPFLADFDSPFPYDGNPLAELPVFNLS